MMSSASSNPPLLSHVRTVAALRKVTDSVKRELDVHPTLPNTLVFSDGRPYAFDLVLPDFDPQVENEAGQLQGQQLMERVFHGLNVGLLHVSIGEPKLPQPKQFLPILREFLKLAEDDGGAHVTCSVVSLGDNVAVDLLDGFATLGRWQDATVLTDRADIERTILRDLLPACDVNLPVFIHCTVETRAGYQGRLLLGALGGTALTAGAAASKTALTGPLDRSLHLLHNALLNLNHLEGDQEGANHAHDQDDVDIVEKDGKERLRDFLLPDFLLHGLTQVTMEWAPAGVSFKATAAGLLLSQALRACPATPVVHRSNERALRLHLQDLQARADVLQADKRQALRQMRNLREELDDVQRTKTELQRRLTLVTSESNVAKAEREDVVARSEWRALELQEQLRQLQVQLFGLEQENGELRREILRVTTDFGHQANQLQQQLDSNQNRHATDLADLECQLGEALGEINRERQTAEQLRRDLHQNASNADDLRGQLREAVREQDRMRHSPSRDLQARELATVRTQLDGARQAEERLSSLLQRQEAKLDKYEHLVTSLQGRIADLQLENSKLVDRTTNQRTAMMMAPDSNNNGGTQELLARIAVLESERRRDREELMREVKLLTQQPPPSSYSQPPVPFSSIPPPSSSSSYYSLNFSQPPTVATNHPPPDIPSANVHGSEQLEVERRPPRKAIFSDKTLTAIDASNAGVKVAVDVLPKPAPRKAPLKPPSSSLSSSTSNSNSSNSSASTAPLANGALSKSIIGQVRGSEEQAKEPAPATKKRAKPQPEEIPRGPVPKLEREAPAPVAKRPKAQLEAEPPAIPPSAWLPSSSTIPLTERPKLPPPSPSKATAAKSGGTGRSLLERTDPQGPAVFVPLHSQQGRGAAPLGDGLSALFRAESSDKSLQTKIKIPDRSRNALKPTEEVGKFRSLSHALHNQNLDSNAGGDGGGSIQPTVLNTIVQNLTIAADKLKVRSRK